MECMPHRKELEILKGAFDSFNKASLRLQSSYAELEKRVRALNLELEEKNRRLEENLREKEKVKNYLHNILESLSNGVVVVDRQKRIAILNRAAERMFHLEAGSAKGQPLSYLNRFLPLDLERLLLNSASQKRPTELIELGGNQGSTYVTVTAAPFMAGGRDFQGTIFIMQDVTRLKRLEEKASRRNRLVAMGEMAASIAHEIRNPLGSIELFASLLKRELEGDRAKEQIAQQIISGVKHLDNVISNLLLFTKSGRLNLQPTPMQKFIQESIDMVNYATGQNGIHMEFLAQGPECQAGVDRQLIQQVLFNLVLNAVQAMPQGGKITVSCGLYDQWFRVEVSDTGPGIPREYLDKIFNPFFTTKDRGMGLGLAIVHNIIEAHNGNIEVESAPGKGTRFTLYLPLNGESGEL